MFIKHNSNIFLYRKEILDSSRTDRPASYKNPILPFPLILRNTRTIDSSSDVTLIDTGTRFIPQVEYGVNTTVTDRRLHLLACQNRAGHMLVQQIEHNRCRDLIRQGQPATVDLWYPPRGTSINQHIANLTTERNAIREDLIDLQETQRNFCFFFQLITIYTSIITFTILV